MNVNKNLSNPFEIQSELDLLVDNELTDEQFRSLVSRLDQSPDLWRQCAMTFINESTIHQALTTERELEKQHTTRSKLRTNRMHPMVSIVAATVCFVFGFAAHSMLNQGRSEMTGHVDSKDSVSRSHEAVAGPVPKRQLVSFGGTHGPNMIVEVQNTPTQAIYYVDYKVPRFLLEALVAAGHSVDISQQMISMEGPEGQVEMPINRIVVDKYALTQL